MTVATWWNVSGISWETSQDNPLTMLWAISCWNCFLSVSQCWRKHVLYLLKDKRLANYANTSDGSVLFFKIIFLTHWTPQTEWSSIHSKWVRHLHSWHHNIIQGGGKMFFAFGVTHLLFGAKFLVVTKCQLSDQQTHVIFPGDALRNLYSSHQTSYYFSGLLAG